MKTDTAEGLYLFTVPREGIGLDSCSAVAELGLITASHARELARISSGVQFPIARQVVGVLPASTAFTSFSCAAGGN